MATNEVQSKQSAQHTTITESICGMIQPLVDAAPESTQKKFVRTFQLLQQGNDQEIRVRLGLRNGVLYWEPSY